MRVVDRKHFAVMVLLACAGQALAERQVVPLPDGTRLEIEAADTNVDIIAHDERTLVLTSPGLAAVSVRAEGGVVVLRIAERGPAHLRLTVPRDIQLNVTAGDAAVAVRGIRGPVTVRNSTQPVTVGDIHGPVDVASRTGRVTVYGIEGEVVAESNTNAVEVHDVSGDVRARSTTSSVRLWNSRSNVVELQSISGIVSYRGAIPRDARYRLGTHSGETVLRIPPGSEATILLHGRPDAFRVQGAALDLPDAGVGRVVLGDGHARIVLESVFGAIRVSVESS